MSDTITKKDLIDRICARTCQKRLAVKRTVQEFLDLIVEELGQGNRIEFRDFGVFETRDRAPRMAQNPKTLQRVPVPAKRTVKFKVGRKMREALEAIEAARMQAALSEQAAMESGEMGELPAPNRSTAVAGGADVVVTAVDRAKMRS